MYAHGGHHQGLMWCGAELQFARMQWDFAGVFHEVQPTLGNEPLQDLNSLSARVQVQREMAAKEKEKKEKELRELAMRARMDRMGGGTGTAPSAAARTSGVAAGGGSDAGPREYPPPPPGPPPTGTSYLVSESMQYWVPRAKSSRSGFCLNPFRCEGREEGQRWSSSLM